MTIKLTPALDRERPLAKLRTWAREYHQPPGFVVGAIDEGVVTSDLLKSGAGDFGFGDSRAERVAISLRLRRPLLN